VLARPLAAEAGAPPPAPLPMAPPPAAAILHHPGAAATAGPGGASPPFDEQINAARQQLIAPPARENRPERRSLLSRGELAKLVAAAAQAYFVRHGIAADPLARRDLVTEILQELLNPRSVDPDAGSNRRLPHRALVESAKAQIQPLVLE